MTGDTKAIIGTIVGTGLVVAGLLSTQVAGLNGRIDDVRADLTAQIAAVNGRIDDMAARMDRIDDRLDRIDDRLDGIDDRLRSVEIAFGKVDQRLLTLERILLPPREPAGG